MRRKDRCPSCGETVSPDDFLCANCELILDPSRAPAVPGPTDVSVVRRMLELPQRGLPTARPAPPRPSAPGSTDATKVLALPPEVNGVPIVVASLSSRAARLTELEAFVVSLIDGTSEAPALAQKTGMGELELRVVLHTLREKQVVDFADEPLAASPPPRTTLEPALALGPAATPPPASAPPEPDATPPMPDPGEEDEDALSSAPTPPFHAGPTDDPELPFRERASPPLPPKPRVTAPDAERRPRVSAPRPDEQIDAAPSEAPAPQPLNPPAAASAEATAPISGSSTPPPSSAPPQAERPVLADPPADTRPPPEPPAPPPPSPPPAKRERTDPRINYGGKVSKKVLDALKQVKRRDGVPEAPPPPEDPDAPPVNVADVRAEPSLQLALRMEQGGRFDDAVRLLESSISKSPDAPSLYNRLAVILMRERADFTRAEKLLRQAVELAPKNNVYSLNLAQVLSRAALGSKSP